MDSGSSAIPNDHFIIKAVSATSDIESLRRGRPARFYGSSTKSTPLPVEVAPRRLRLINLERRARFGNLSFL
jgi:hypothetical protein